jgi:hypothetical protein
MKSKLWRIPHLVLLAGLLLLIFTLPALAQNNPVPLINQPLVPDAVSPGGSAFTLTVNGTGFVSSSVVHWNGSARATTFVGDSQVTAAISAADIANAGTASVTVVNRAPGGGTSNVAFLSITNPTTFVTMSLASSPQTGFLPYSVAVGDFNGDGNLDLAIANFGGGGGNTLSILLGDGTGNFSLASSPATGSGPYSVAVGDFNGDGKLDLAVANVGSSTVSILLGDGTGNFTLASSPATGIDPASVAVGDFNGDGKLDLAVANACGNNPNCNSGGTVSILLGDGTGNFALASSPATGNKPYSVAVGDFNGDGKLDLAVANNGSNTVSILLGDGTGNFTLASSPVTGNSPISVAVADFNGDGKLDLAVANQCGNDPNCDSAGTVSILLGDGTGNFTLASSPGTGYYPNSVAVGDFNGDGKLDLAVANLDDSTVSILLGDGTGNFTLTSSPATGNPDSVAVGDFNGDGKQDLAVANFESDSAMVSILVQAPAVMLSSSSLAFGNQNVGSMSDPMRSTLTNTGSATLTISGISVTGTNAGDFTMTNTCGTIVLGGASCTINVTFDPSAPGMRTASVNITDNAPGSPQMIALSGTGVAPAVTLAPTSLTFGNQLLGTTSPAQTVTLTNSGTETLTITSIAISGNFSQTNTCGTSVAMGASCTISVTFKPLVIHMQTGAVTITDNAFGSPQQMVPLTGTGTEVKLTPASLTFPVQLVGTTSAAKKVTLTNVGTTAFKLIGISITGADGGDFSQTNTCPASVGAGKSCTIKVKFTPTAGGTRTASVSVSDNGGGIPQTVALSGTGTAVKLSTNKLNFGDVKVGKISPPKVVVLTNVGSTTLSITSITVTGKDNGDFTVSNSCHGSVGAGGTCNIIVRFIPTLTGLRTADVSITDNGGASPQKISLSGTGT